MADTKITPAMRDWCRRLNIPTNYRLARTSYGMYRMEGVSGARPPTHPMVERLERAGLIEWSNGLRGVIHARLTAAGSSVALGVAMHEAANDTLLRVNSIAREAIYERSLVLYLNRKATDDELRAIHDLLRDGIPHDVDQPDGAKHG